MKLVAALFTVSLLSLLGGCSTLSAEPVSARVVDSDTGKPLAGVVVVAFWDLHQGSLFGHAPSCGTANLEEAVTDEEGKFQIRGWGPITNYCGMGDENPYLTLFKPGYHVLGLSNMPVHVTEAVSVSRSRWNGKALALEKFPDLDLRRDDLKSYAWEFEGLNSTLGLYVFSACHWKQIPNMLRAIYLQQQEFTAAGHADNSITTKLIANDSAIQKAAPQCGSPKAFIEGLVK